MGEKRLAWVSYIIIVDFLLAAVIVLVIATVYLAPVCAS